MSESLTLYEMAADVSALMSIVIDPESPKQEADALARLDALGPALLAKVDRYSAFMAHMESQVAAAKIEEARLAARRRRFEAALDWLQSNAIRVMNQNGWKELDGDTVTLAIRQNPPSVIVDDENALPPEYIRITQTQSVDRNAIKAAIKAGETVPGARLESRQGLRRK